MKDRPQMAQISYNICFHQIHVHYPQYLLTFYIFVLTLSLAGGKMQTCGSADVATGKMRM